MAKVMKWYGKTEEEIQKMDQKEFLSLVPSRIRRSLQRGLNDQQKKLMLKVEKNHKNLKTHCRNTPIVPSMVGKTIKVYSGKEFIPVIIAPEMLGHFLGEFVMTRKALVHGSAGLGATRSSKAVSAK